MTNISDLQDGSAIIEQNPHPAIDKIINQGYNFKYRIEQAELSKELMIKVVSGENAVAEANFTDQGSDTVIPQNIRVLESWRRQGIATAIYILAEKILGKPLCNFWSDDDKQAPEAKALWAQPNRPFGNPLNAKPESVQK